MKLVDTCSTNMQHEWVDGLSGSFSYSCLQVSSSVKPLGWRAMMLEDDSVVVVGWVVGMARVTTDVEGKLFFFFFFFFLK